MNDDAQPCTKEVLFGNDTRLFRKVCWDVLLRAAYYIFWELRKQGLFYRENINILYRFGLYVDPTCQGSCAQDKYTDKDVPILSITGAKVATTTKRGKGKKTPVPEPIRLIAEHLHSILFSWWSKRMNGLQAGVEANDLMDRKPEDSAASDIRPQEELSPFWLKAKYMSLLIDSRRRKDKSGESIDTYYWKRFADALRNEKNCLLRSFKGINPCSVNSIWAYTFSFDGDDLPVFSMEHITEEEQSEYQRVVNCVPPPLSLDELQKDKVGKKKAEGLGAEAIVTLCRHYWNRVHEYLGTPHAVCLGDCLNFLRRLYPTVFDEVSHVSFDEPLSSKSAKTLAELQSNNAISRLESEPDLLEDPLFSSKQLAGIKMMVGRYVSSWPDAECIIFYEGSQGTPDSKIKLMIGQLSSSRIQLRRSYLLRDIRVAIEQHPLSENDDLKDALGNVFLDLTIQACKSRLQRR